MDSSLSPEVKDDDRKIIFQAHCQCGQIHDPQLLLNGFMERDLVVTNCIWIGDRISVVDAVDLGGLQQYIGANFSASRPSRYRGSQWVERIFASARSDNWCPGSARNAFRK